jgi:hypothetical protein
MLLATAALLIVSRLAEAHEPATRPTINIDAPTTAPTTSPHVPGSAPMLPKRVHVPELGIRFSVPGDFIPGRLEPTNSDLDRAVVFVEQRLAPDDPQRIPSGGAVPVIVILRQDALGRRVFDMILEESWKTEIGRNKVYKLPAYPGPFGEEAHCYLLPRPDSTALLLIAHRMHPRDAAGKRAITHYDWVVEGIIASLFFVNEPE